MKKIYYDRFIAKIIKINQNPNSLEVKRQLKKLIERLVRHGRKD